MGQLANPIEFPQPPVLRVNHFRVIDVEIHRRRDPQQIDVTVQLAGPRREPDPETGNRPRIDFLQPFTLVAVDGDPSIVLTVDHAAGSLSEMFRTREQRLTTNPYTALKDIHDQPIGRNARETAIEDALVSLGLVSVEFT